MIATIALMSAVTITENEAFHSYGFDCELRRPNGATIRVKGTASGDKAARVMTLKSSSQLIPSFDGLPVEIEMGGGNVASEVAGFKTGQAYYTYKIERSLPLEDRHLLMSVYGYSFPKSAIVLSAVGFCREGNAIQ